MTPKEVVDFLNPILKNITYEDDAREFVRIYLDSLGIENVQRENIYGLLAKKHDTFVDVLVASLTIPTSDFKLSTGQFKLKNVALAKAIKVNDYKIVLTIKSGKKQYEDQVFVNDISHDIVVEHIFITSNAVEPTHAVVGIPIGRPKVANIQEAGYYGVARIYTQKYHEPKKCLNVVKIGKKTKGDPVTAVVNTELFPVE